jgi:hypothetical protein
MRYLLLLMLLIPLGCSDPCKCDISKFEAKLNAIHTDLLVISLEKQMPIKCNNPACDCPGPKCQCEDCQCNLVPEPKKEPVRTVAGVDINTYLQDYKSDVTYTGTSSIEERLIRCGLTAAEIAALTEEEKQKVYSAYWNKQPAMAAPSEPRWECKNGRCRLIK